MKELKIVEVKPYGLYVLEDKDGERQSLILEFYGVDDPKIGDKLIISETLLNRNLPSFVQPYAFGKMDNEHGRAEENLSENEMLGLHTKEGDFVLKRIYG